MLKRALFNNWLMKIVSLALSTALWIAVTGDEAVVVKSLDAPLEFRNVPANADIECREGGRVEVFLRGPSSLIHEISTEDISVGVNASNLEYGPNTVALTAEAVRHPYGVEIVRISPPNLTVELRNVVAR